MKLDLNRHTLSRACSMWNHLTSPSALRTEREHSIHRKAARKVRTILDRWPSHCIHETEHTGKIYPVS